MIRFLLLVTLLALPGAAQAATYYVAQGHAAASDENPGTAAKPWKSIAHAAQAVQPGDEVLIGSGIYREAVAIETSGTAAKPIRFAADLAANVIVTGADRLTEWRKESESDNIFSAPWPHQFIGWTKNHTHPDDDEHRLIGRAEQVFVLGYPLRQVLRREELSRGSFWVDEANQRLFVWNADNQDISKDSVLVEASTRNVTWQQKGDYVQVRGLRFRYAANRAQEGAAQFSGDHNVVEDCVFERTNGVGAVFTGESTLVRRCTFQDNGQLGWSANGTHDSIFTGCLTRNNNTKGFSRGWEAGGDKIVLTRGLVIENSRFTENRGTGIWFDIGNENCTVRNCLIADNEDAGIFYEISYSLHAHDNVIVGNGFSGTPGSWGAAAGISLSSSPECVIERNLIVGNKEGFNFREQNRTTPRLNSPQDGGEVAVWNHDSIIRNNVLAYNRDAQTWGWFDVNDERHWPAAMQQKKPETGTAAANLAADYIARDAKGQPVGLSLEKLHLTFADNLYAAQPGQQLFHWGVSWKRNQEYSTLDAVHDELKLEQGSIVAPFLFADYLTRDFRVPADSPALKLGAYPRGEVPGVELGRLGS